MPRRRPQRAAGYGELKEYDRIVQHNGVAFANAWLAQRRAKPGRGRRTAIVAYRPRPSRIGVSEKFGGVSGVIDACCTRWADLLANPFDSNDLCGLPTGSTQLSQKVKVWIKSALTTGTTPKTGGFAFSPITMAANDYVGGALIVTGSGYGATDIPSTGDVGTSALNSNAPYGAAAFGGGNSALQYRVVLAAIRLVSATTKLNEGASLMAYANPAHAPVSGQDAAAIMAHDDTHNVVMKNGQPNTFVWIPRSYTTEVEYSTTVSDNYCVGGIVIDPSTTATKVNVEAVAIIEYIGDDARGKTDSMSSPMGDQFLDRAHAIYKAGVAAVNGVARGYQVARDFHDHLVRQGYIQSPLPLRQRHQGSIEL